MQREAEQKLKEHQEGEEINLIESAECNQAIFKNMTLQIQQKGPTMSVKGGEIFLSSISYACEALIACTRQLNRMDKDSGDCGTTIARGATTVLSFIKENKITGTRPVVTFTWISHIIKQTMGGLQGELYSLFFYSIAQTFAQSSNNDLSPHLWLNALAAGNKVLLEFGGASQGDLKMLDPLLVAQSKLENVLQQKLDAINAFGEAVKAVENSVIDTMPTKASYGHANLTKSKELEYPDPRAHAVAIWMRAAYEGFKLKFICECDMHINVCDISCT